MLVAATGVGTGEIATGSFAGSLLGNAILWAVLVGAFLKYVITEGLARWQLATGTTILEGAADNLGKGAVYIFLPYLLLWTFFTASALMSACGIAFHAMFPLFDNPVKGKIVFGIAASLVGTLLVYKGGFRLFEKIMTACIVLMFFTVVTTAVLLWPGTDEVLRGIFVPRIPDADGAGLTWTVALIGGVGGTVTVLSYGYWIREEGRSGGDDLRICRIDLATGYLMTAVFSMSMVIVGSNLEISGSGASLIVDISERLAEPLGVFGKWLFLIGAAGTVFSSLLGTWQATPYFFADSWQLLRERGDAQRVIADTDAPAYRGYLIALAVVPMLGLFFDFRQVQKFYAFTGAFFVPMLAVVLLVLNGRSRWVGQQFRNGPVTFVSLAAALAFFLWVAASKIF
ncbi:MAG: Nramp family divalent metal transporter [Gammaproteobacteria bacterium]|nr:Nramp family divalent metal transporter [Gammaproteobacteria bacterium]